MAADLDEIAGAALTDRDALASLLAAAGLGAHAQRLAHEVAADGLYLVPVPDGGVRSRLGGPGLLPEGARWPAREYDGGRIALSFLAGIDLAELPPSQVADALPAAGWMLFFAELEECDLYGSKNDPSDDIRVLVTDADAVVREAQPPADIAVVLERRFVGARRVLTLPYGCDVVEEFGLDDDDEDRYMEALDALGGALDPSGRDVGRDIRRIFEMPDAMDQFEAMPAPPQHTGTHWLGGLERGCQGHPPAPGTVLLLHIQYDDALGLGIFDGGDIQFRIPQDALAARDWSAITTTVEYG